MKKDKMRLHKPFQMIHNPISYSHQTPASTSCKSFHQRHFASNNIERSEHKDKQRHATQDLGCHFTYQACRCQKDDVVHRDNSPSSSGSGSSGTHMVRKRSKRPNDAGTSGAGDEE
ncbi:hypothetical protein Bca52824_089028 [Brassica carinata]|uniref:Uncharacterized protein n=1 Tax=Brassica carinata TaxID=52824 RepID=A0A8X7PDN9_BRACI|nr:hypothetical protein Bca52824_089028 [Brassica carinata]